MYNKIKICAKPKIQMYNVSKKNQWLGRNDGENEGLLYHHKVQRCNITHQLPKKGVSLLGFKSDEGVRRNLGRVGAKYGPDEIRKALSHLVAQGSINIYDVGDISLENNRLEQAQKELSEGIIKLLSHNQFPILLGGGHEISYGHASGLFQQFPDKKIGIINFDPHFDLRAYPNGAHSGSWARQLFDEFANFHYLSIGINQAVNLPTMYQLMEKRAQFFIDMFDLLNKNTHFLNNIIDDFIRGVDVIGVTLDMDVFSSGVAPGVSALNPYGAMPEHILPLLHHILKSPKAVSFDVAELNPRFDDGRTAKLASFFIHEVIKSVEQLTEGRSP